VEEKRSKNFFEEWFTKETNKWGLYDVWVQIKGCPEPLCRDYLALFVVGSLIGKTEEVNMKYTREKGVVRARVSCLNPMEIPQSVSHYYDGEGYNIEFVIESVDGETIADDNQGENGEDDSENKENDSNHNDDTKKGEPGKEMQEDTNQEGIFSGGKRNVGV
jgi:hypothetical protein